MLTAGTLFAPFTFGSSSSFVTFNNYAPGTDPVFRAQVRVFAETRQLREFDSDNPGILGDLDFQTLEGGSHAHISGTMYPRTLNGYMAGKELLRKVCNLELVQNDPESDYGYLPLKWTDGTHTKMVFCKPVSVDLPESTRAGLKQPFKILFKVRYPVSLGQTPNTTTINSSQTGGVTTVIFPAIFPAVFGAAQGTGSGVVTNNGDFPTYPSITINGPINNPKIANTTSGKFLKCSVNLPSTSDFLVYNYSSDQQLVLFNNNNALGQVTSDSSFFRVHSGTANFTLTGDSVGVGAQAVIVTRDAWPLS